MSSNLDSSLLDRVLFASPVDDAVLEDKDIVCGGIVAASNDIFLPLVVEAAGRIYVLFCAYVRTAGTVTIKINSEDAGDIIYFETGAAAASFTWDAEDEYSVLYSDGERWFELKGDH